MYKNRRAMYALIVSLSPISGLSPRCTARWNGLHRMTAPDNRKLFRLTPSAVDPTVPIDLSRCVLPNLWTSSCPLSESQNSAHGGERSRCCMRHDRAKGTNTGLSVRELRAVGAYVAAARGPGSLPARHVGCANCAADVSVRRQSLPGEKAGLCGLCDPAGKASDRVYRAVESAGLFLGFIAALPEPPPRGSLAVPGPYWVQRLSQEPPRSPLCVRPPPLYGL